MPEPDTDHALIWKTVNNYCYVIVKAAFFKQVQFSYVFPFENLFEVVFLKYFCMYTMHMSMHTSV